MTDLRYAREAYLKEFAATVVAVRRNDVLLDRTAFYPTGGDQPHNLGTIQRGGSIWPGIELKKQRIEVLHRPQAGPVIGSTDAENKGGIDKRLEIVLE